VPPPPTTRMRAVLGTMGWSGARVGGGDEAEEAEEAEEADGDEVVGFAVVDLAWPMV
jgi:hypothetical protein